MKKILSTALLLSTAFLFAQETGVTLEQPNNGWKLSMGANFRSFDKIKLKKLSINSGEFINGSVTDIGGGNYLYEVADPNSQIVVDPTVNDIITYTTATATANNVEIDGGLAGIVFKASSELGQSDIFSWYMDLSLTTAYSKTSFDQNESVVFTDTSFDFGPDWNSSVDGSGNSHPGPYPPGAPVDGKTEGVSGNYDPFPVAGTISAMDIRYDLNLGVYTFGVGISGACQLGPVNLFLGGGPTLSVVDYDLDRKIVADSYLDSESYDSTRLRAGAYAELGMELPLGEKWGIGVSGRYDWIPVDINTELAKIELSGFSGNLFLSYQF